MKRIGNSKEPTEQQIKNILSNLHEKFPYDSFNIEMKAWYFKSGTNTLEYRLYSDIKGNLFSDNQLDYREWSELIKAYRRIIND